MRQLVEQLKYTKKCRSWHKNQSYRWRKWEYDV